MPNHWWGVATFTFGLFVILDLTKWVPLRFWGATSGEHFVDTKQILNSVACLEENSSVQSSELCSNYVYGKSLLKSLSWLHINPAQTPFLGFLFLGLLAVALGIVSVKSGVSHLMYLAVVLSPPVLLLAERANFDILMLTLVVFASLLSPKGRQFGSTLLLALASVFKFYTIPLMFMQAIYTKKPVIRTVIISASAVTTYLISNEILATRKLMNPTSGISYNNGEGFGFDIWAGYLPRFKKFLPLDLGLAGYLFSSVILIFVIFATLLFLRLKKIESTIYPISHDYLYRTFEYLLIVHLSCFFAGVSIDYRLIFITTATLSYVSSTSTTGDRTAEKNLLLGLLVVALWCTYPSNGLQIIGDFSLMVLTLLLVIQAARQRLIARKLPNK